LSLEPAKHPNTWDKHSSRWAETWTSVSSCLQPGGPVREGGEDEHRLGILAQVQIESKFEKRFIFRGPGRNPGASSHTQKRLSPKAVQRIVPVVSIADTKRSQHEVSLGCTCSDGGQGESLVPPYTRGNVSHSNLPRPTTAHAGTSMSSLHATYQGLTLVPISAQLELFYPPYNPTYLMNVSWSCSS